MEFRRAVAADYPEIVELESQNLASALTQTEKEDGFLSGFFNAEQLAVMNDDLCIVVCLENQRLLGFLCAGTVEFNKTFGLPMAMITRYPQIRFQNKSLDSYLSYVSGPVCVQRTERGRGIFQGLYAKLFELLPREYELAATLISINNPRSLSAHEKIGFERVDRFEQEERVFDTLAMRIPR